MKPVLVISPHLDDAVYSAGEFLAGRPGAVVVTMLAGAPNPPVFGTRWDKRCEFTDSQQAMEARRVEDEAALALLGATPVHLDFLDVQYKPADQSDDLAEALIEQVEHHRPEFVVGPVGIEHGDHVLVRDAVLAAEDRFDVPLWLYGDLPYRVVLPHIASDALGQIRGRGYTLELGDIATGPPELKRAAVNSYPSQTKNFDIDKTIMVPERFWRVTRR
jgi:LmbE family N-acetylglucosaminyl deacetylase